MADEKSIEAVKLEFTPAVFDPNKEQLHAIAKDVAGITADPSKMTKEDFELVNSTKNKLVKARTTIQKKGKELREDALKFQRDVISYEKELIAIIEPEEQRLKEIETAAKEFAMKEERLKTLPEFKEKLAAIGVEMPDEHLLTLDPNGRIEFYNKCLSDKLEADRAADDARRAEEDAKRAEEQKKLDDEREKIDAEKRLAEEREWGARTSRILGMGFVDAGEHFEFGEVFIVKEQAREVTSEKFEQIIAAAVPTIAGIKKRLADEAEAKRQEEIKKAQEQAKEEERKRLEKEEEERKEAAEKEAAARAAEEAERSRAESYQKWLVENSYNAETDYIAKGEAVDILYRKVATYQHPTT